MPETQQPARKLATAALMASLTVVLFSLAALIPLFGSVVRFFIAVPIALSVVLCQTSFGVMAAVTAGLLIGMLFGPLSAWQFVTWFALSGVVMGMAMQREQGFAKAFGATLVSVVAGLVLYYSGLFLLMDWDIQSMIAEVAQVKDQILTMYREAGVLDALEQQSVGALTEFTALLDQTVYYLTRLIPSMLVVMGLLQVALQFWGLNHVLQRMSLRHLRFPAFRNWHFPSALVIPLIIAWAIYLGRAYLPWTWLEVPTLNVLFLLMLVAVLDGLAYIFYRFTEIPMSGFTKVLLVFFVLFFFNGILIVAALAGIFDMLLDFRQRSSTKKE